MALIISRAVVSEINFSSRVGGDAEWVEPGVEAF